MNVFSSRLGRITTDELNQLVIKARHRSEIGRLPRYIPSFARANPQWFAVHVETSLDQNWVAGDTHILFSLMSVVKPFLLLYVLEHLGEEQVFQHVGMQPSDLPFNSLTQLQADRGFPRNPMLNSGAIALVSLMPGYNGAERCERFRRWLNQHSGARLMLDHDTLSSVKALPNEQNRAIAQVLGEAGQLHSPVSDAIDTYERVCCLAGRIGDLARLGTLLTQPRATIASYHCRTVIALMTTCGLYEDSSRFAVEVGLPTKSGVSGALLAVMPREGAIACYSPPLDAVGNSVGGLYFLKHLARQFNLNVFG